MNKKFWPILLVILTFLICFLRRPDQFFNASFWCDDSQILEGYALNGWNSLFDPVQGYSIFIPKLINFISYSISFAYSPEIALILTVAFITFVVVAIYKSPTIISYKAVAAVYVLLLPTDAEVFSTALNSYFWASLLLVLVVIWREENSTLMTSRQLLIRSLFLIIGGLSSPLIIPISVLLLLKLILRRTARDLILCLTAIYLSLFQYNSLAEGNNVHPPNITYDFLSEVIRKFFGLFISYDWFSVFANQPYIQLILGATLVIVLGWIVFSQRSLIKIEGWLLIIFLCMSVAAAVARVDIVHLDPRSGGPRYFFIPWTLLGWLIIYLYSLGNVLTVRLFLSCSIFFALVGGHAAFTRRHEHINWRKQVKRCHLSQKDNFIFDFHFVGSKDMLWHSTISTETCREMNVHTFWSVFPKDTKSKKKIIQ